MAVSTVLFDLAAVHRNSKHDRTSRRFNLD
jgi:hypothetical protein